MKPIRPFGRNLPVLLYVFLLLSTPAPAVSSQVTDQLKSTIDGVLHIVTNVAYKENKKERRKLIKELIDRRFSYEQMGMRSLAKNWKTISVDEQKEFVRLFSKLLENSYASKIEAANKEKVDYGVEKIKGRYALVKTKIVRKDGPIDVDYKLILLEGQWKVYDIVIEGVSLIRNYRSQFNRIINLESYDVLKQKIIRRISDIEADHQVSDEL